MKLFSSPFLSFITTKENSFCVLFFSFKKLLFRTYLILVQVGSIDFFNFV